MGTGIPGRTFTTRPAQVIDVEKAEIDLENTRKQVAVDLTQAYLDVLAADKVLQSLKAGLEQARENHRLASLRYGVGVGTSLEVLQASERWLAPRVPPREGPVQLPPGGPDLRDRQGGPRLRPLGRVLHGRQLLKRSPGSVPDRSGATRRNRFDRDLFLV
ncbi:MAG: TolC family protein [Desulfotomaculales bacterium]